MILKENMLFSISFYLISNSRSLMQFMDLRKKCEWKPDEEDVISEALKEKDKIEDEKRDEGKKNPREFLNFG